MSAEVFLSRLSGVRRTGEGRWVAQCPAHDDRGPSLSVRDVGDGRTLLHCFAGCEVADVLAAIGATWADLFPERRPTDPPLCRRREHVANAADALRCLAFEATVIAIAAGDIARGVPLTEVDRQRLLLAAQRISSARGTCNA